MNETFVSLVLLCGLICSTGGVSFEKQIKHIIKRRQESLGIDDDLPPTRRKILGTPSFPNHLPPAEEILPGHTLIRPALGMLKSAIKFPHKDPDNGAWVYGNIDNLSIRYNGQNKRVLYSGFRRGLQDYIMIIPKKSTGPSIHPRFSVASTVLDLDSNEDNQEQSLLEEIKELSPSFTIYDRNEKRAETKNRNYNVIEDILKQYNKQRNEEDSPSNSKYLSNKKKDTDYFAYTKHSKDNLSSAENIVQYIINEMQRAKKFTDNIKKKSLRQDQPDEGEALSDALSSISSEESNIGQFQLNQTESISTDEDALTNKTKWFWSTMNAYDHIKFNAKAIELDEIMPVKVLNDNIRNWWFFHQEDFVPFTQSEDN